ncbi:MmpS family transport accessory protein [Umezawaea beigongshangensis]|uniref:MmpS family transport accessory protein n=1 Tax=Umezawaea beigongshangensis TaxID=2780383 RepID=UPI0018F18D02|nr:MmpS family transport accessory protein [Umezawaea beigongshangensis]
MSYSPPQESQPVRQRNGLGTAGFVLGLVGLLFSFVPIVGVVAWPLVVLGLVLSVLGVVRARSGRADNGGLAVAGVVLSAIGLLVCVLWVAAFGSAANEVDERSSQQSTVVYEVTGDAPGATVTYSTFDGGGSSTSSEDPASLPWQKELRTSGPFSSGTLTVSTDERGGTVACRITVDGVEKKTATGSGRFSSAICGGF